MLIETADDYLRGALHRSLLDTLKTYIISADVATVAVSRFKTENNHPWLWIHSEKTVCMKIVTSRSRFDQRLSQSPGQERISRALG